MSQRTNRAFYSEPLISFPGRLHITAEKICVEVLVKEDGQRRFHSYTPDEFEELNSILCKQDYYREGFEEAYKKELFEITLRAEHIQSILFNDRKSAESVYCKKDGIIYEPEVGMTEPADNIFDEYNTNRVDFSSEDMPILEDPIFEKNEYDETITSIVPEEKVSSMASKYIGKFANLHIQKINGKYAPDKAIFLMSVISLYDGGNKHRSSTILCNKELEQLYDSKWEKYRPGAPAVDFKKTFLTMGDESFWHLNLSGKKGELSAQIDPGLVMTLNQQSARSLLRKTLYNRYLK